jgi:two-component system, sensor histidine kinase YesM
MVKIPKATSTLMGKLLIQFSVIIIIMFFLTAYSLYSFKAFYSNFYSMLDHLVTDYKYSSDIDLLYQHINNYAHSGNEDYLNKYYTGISRLKNSFKNLKESSSGDLYYKFRNLENMTKTFDEKSEIIIKDYKSGQQNIYINQSITELFKLDGYIQDELKGLLNWKLSNIQTYYQNFNGQIQNGENLIYIIFIFTTILCVFFAYRFSRRISVPIHQLVLSLQKVGKGDLDSTPIDYKSKDEIGILFESFSNMTIQIKNLIQKIKEKAHLERKIKEQEIKNLEMSNLLNNSELKFLQSQINPHFLFNTINTISILADIEEAPRTQKVLECMSDILRYNFKKLEKNVTLKEEYGIVKNYLHIQNVRFGERIQFIVNVDKSLRNCMVPSMILQPFVENAIVHGLEPKIGNGILELSISSSDDQIKVLIRDNGLGIQEDKIKGFFAYKDVLEEDSQSGIGVINVIRRLELIYGKNVVEIRSELGKGTEVRITIPKT